MTAAHFNHHLRPTSGLDEMAAEAAARKLGVPFISGGADVYGIVREQKLSVEEAARQCRYNWLFEQARLLQCAGYCRRTYSR